jgi:tRNA A22 N-methylase
MGLGVFPHAPTRLLVLALDLGTVHTYLPRYLIKERGEETGGRMDRNT